MSFSDHVLLWLHVAFAIFAIGPGTAAIMSTPRCIRTRNVVVLRYLHRVTRGYAAASLLAAVFGLVLAQQRGDFSHPWVTASVTLFAVAIVLLILVMRDQLRAIAALTAAASHADTPARSVAAVAGAVQPAAPDPGPVPVLVPAPAAPAPPLKLAAVERGRLASIGGMIGVIWLVILALMVWNG